MFAVICLFLLIDKYIVYMYLHVFIPSVTTLHYSHLTLKSYVKCSDNIARFCIAFLEFVSVSEVYKPDKNYIKCTKHFGKIG
jgi:hypothetical protein